MTGLVEHVKYLERVSVGPDATIAPETAAQSLVTLNDARRHTPGLGCPAASTGPDGSLMLLWDTGLHHLSVEFWPHRPLEWFYRHRETGNIWGDMQAETDPLSSRVIAALALVATFASTPAA